MTDNVVWHQGAVERRHRAAITGGEGLTLWMTGLSGSGKSTIAHAVEHALVSQGRAAYVLDGDNVRHGLNGDLGFSKSDRAENVRRLGEVAKLMADAGIVSIVPAISPYAVDRDRARQAHEEMDLTFVEVFVDTPLEICEQRDPKGLYAKARRGEIEEFTGVSDPYEEPNSPDLHLKTEDTSVEDSVARILKIVGLSGDVH